MDEQRDLTKINEGEEEIEVKYRYELLTPIQQAYIDWKALSGLVTTDEGELKKITLADMAAEMNIDRRTFYDQTVHIPNLYELIAERRHKLAPKSRIARVHETWYLKAVRGEWQHMNAWLYNFDPSYKTPTQKVEHDVGDTLADLLDVARSQKQPKNITNGEAINGDQSHTTTNT